MNYEEYDSASESYDLEKSVFAFDDKSCIAMS